MTPEERADKIDAQYIRAVPPCTDIVKIIAAAIREAVAEEREACVETASDVFLIGLSPSEQALELRVKINVASDIRARKP